MSKLHVFLCRHAPREGSEDHITGIGNQKAYALGEALRRSYPQRNFIGMCSQCLRTRQTAEAILAGAGWSGAPITQEVALQNGEFDPGWVQEETTSPINVYLRFGDKRPDAHALAPREVAAHLAQLFYSHLSVAPSPTTLVAVTHSGNIEAFLADLLGFRQVEAIGGMLDYLEGVTLLCEQSQDAALSMQASFRGRTYAVSDNVLQSLLKARR